MEAHLKTFCNKKAPTKLRLLVLEAGLEPARPKGHKILSLACLPIPPLEHNPHSDDSDKSASEWDSHNNVLTDVKTCGLAC